MARKARSFRVGKVAVYLRRKVWYLCYYEHGRRCRPRVGPDKELVASRRTTTLYCPTRRRGEEASSLSRGRASASGSPAGFAVASTSRYRAGWLPRRSRTRSRQPAFARSRAYLRIVCGSAITVSCWAISSVVNSWASGYVRSRLWKRRAAWLVSCGCRSTVAPAIKPRAIAQSSGTASIVSLAS